jgi:hypothetical protein
MPRHLHPPLDDAPCANPIEFFAKRVDLLKAVVEFAEFRRCYGCWLSECLDLNINQQADFIFDFDGTGWLEFFIAGASNET